MGKKRLSRHFKAKNARRLALIEQEASLGITDAEARELEDLTQWEDAELDRVLPLSLGHLSSLEAAVQAALDEERLF